MRGEVKKKRDAQPRQSMMLKNPAPGPKKKINLSVYPGFSGDDGAGRPILRHHRHASSLGGAGHDAGKWQHGNEGAPAGSPLGRGGLGGRRSRARDQQGIHPSLM